MHTLSGIVWAMLRAVELLLVIRAILSWIPVARGLSDILETVTEPLILPARVLFDKLGVSLPIPIDLPFFVTLIAISVLESLIFTL
jgi:hypothetical protein